MKAQTSSLRWRLFLIYLLLAIIVLGGAATLVYFQVQSRLIENRLAQTREMVSWALTSAEPLGSLEVDNIQQIIDSLSVTPTPDFSFYLLNTNGELVASLGQGKPHFIRASFTETYLFQISDGSEAFRSVDRSEGDLYRTLTSIWPIYDTTGTFIGALQCEVRLDEADKTLAGLVRVFTISFSVLFIAASILWFLLVRATLRPLETLARVSREVHDGKLERRVPVSKVQDEAHHTAVAFNEMLDSLQAYISREKENKLKMQLFLADASHELRTPITVLRGYIDVLRRGMEENPEALQDALTTMHNTVDKMTQLTNDLLNLSQLDLARDLNLETIELNVLCQSAVDSAQIFAKSRQLEFVAGPQVKILGDARLLEQVLWNLLNNSVRHTTPDGLIVVKVSRQGTKGYIAVEDNGNGIPEEYLPRIFDRFYRVDPASPGGSGLGLSIVKSIVEAHHGEVTVQSSPGHGATFTVILPLIV